MVVVDAGLLVGSMLLFLDWDGFWVVLWDCGTVSGRHIAGFSNKKDKNREGAAAENSFFRVLNDQRGRYLVSVEFDRLGRKKMGGANKETMMGLCY
mmetsp:Transcript_28132/g.58892  ORF Transcript_28132/g.58892 Transcript_28132/m.58892 type:complete len:96 (-) Transcript_28132:80-367(-)